MTVIEEAKLLLLTEYLYIYRRDGSIEREIPHIDGKIHGLIKTYYEDGTIETETLCINDERHGITKYYDKRK